MARHERSSNEYKEQLQVQRVASDTDRIRIRIWLIFSCLLEAERVAHKATAEALASEKLVYKKTRIALKEARELALLNPNPIKP